MAATVLRSAHETCTLCHFRDHSTEQCALFSQEPPKAPRPPARPSPYRVKPYAVPKPLNSEPCRRFNRGACPSMAETCRYSHTCSACEKPGHGAVSCPDPLSLATKKKGALQATKTLTLGDSLTAHYDCLLSLFLLYYYLLCFQLSQLAVHLQVVVTCTCMRPLLHGRYRRVLAINSARIYKRIHTSGLIH